MEFSWFDYVILPLLIFLARVLDVSIGTIRMVFISKGFKKIAPVLGFFEILIWIIAVKQIMDNLTHPILYFAYAGGFAFGTYIGMKIEEKLSVGKVLVRIFIKKENEAIISELRKDYRITVSEAQGRDGNVKIVFAILNKKKMKPFLKKIKNVNSKAFYTIEDIKYANDLFDKVKERRRFFEVFRKKK